MKPAGGNRCRHNPRLWRVTLARPFRPDQPKVLHLAAEAFTRELREHPERWPELAQAQQRLFGRRVNRFRRSEIREALALVIRACLTRMDVTTRRVGWKRRASRDFQGLPRKTIANWTERAQSSVARATELLRYAGIMSGPGHKGPNIIRQPVDRCDDSHEHLKVCPGRIERIVNGVAVRGCHGLPAVRQISRWFFERLGLDGLLDGAIEAAAAKAAAPPAPVLELVRRPPPERSTVKLVAALAAKKSVGPPDSG